MDFKAQLAAYKQAIDADIAAYAAHVRASTRAQYGTYPGVVSDGFLDLLSRGGKRIRGALVMVGYQMCGGRDTAMITRAATAVEMMHAYILLIDDIQDRSALRRGKPTVHKLLETYHQRHHLKGSAAHAGVSLGLNAAMSGSHAAQMLLAGLEVEAELRLKAIGIINHTMLVTAHGQTADIMNQLTPKVTRTNIDRVMEWKTAHYTFLNPLCVGMVLAGAGCESTDAIRQYALHAGIAFQITDDCIGLFGSKAAAGKDPMDDMREGKHTLLINYALKHSAPADAAFLATCLGNSKITKQDFARVKRIVKNSGAYNYARATAARHIAVALKSLEAEKQQWEAPGVAFLEALVRHLAP